MPPHKTRPITAKESHKWLAGVAAVTTLRQRRTIPADTTVVVVGDRESDRYDLRGHPRPAGVHLLIRAAHNRAVAEEQPSLWGAVGAAPDRVALGVTLPPRAGRPARGAALTVRWRRVTLSAPRHRAAERWDPVTWWAVWAHESHPPPDREAVSWLLLTTWPVTEAATAQTIVQWYTGRWGIAVWHRILKSGCRIEARPFDCAADFIRCLTLYRILAWRVQYATHLARVAPDQPCRVVFAPAEWQALTCVMQGADRHRPRPHPWARR